MAEQAQPPVLNPSGKFQLRSNGKKITAHREIVGHPQFQDSLNLALLNFARKLQATTGDSNSAAVNMLKLNGAQEFAQEFIQLAEEFKPEVVKSQTGQLDHKA